VVKTGVGREHFVQQRKKEEKQKLLGGEKKGKKGARGGRHSLGETLKNHTSGERE